MYDDSIAGQDRIEQLLNELRARRSPDHDGVESPAPESRDDNDERREPDDDATKNQSLTNSERSSMRSARRRFVLVVSRATRRRLDRLAARHGVRPARARQGRPCRQRRSGAGAADGVSRRAGDRDCRPHVEGEFDAAIIMECGDLTRTGVTGLDRYFVINIDHHPGNTGYGQMNWFDCHGRPPAARWCSTWSARSASS